MNTEDKAMTIAEMYEKLKQENKELKYHLERKEKEYDRMIAFCNGMIDGLKYAIRCNGISGGEVDD